MNRYYPTRPGGTTRYSGARFETVAALNTDPNTLGPADFVAVSMPSVKVPGQAALRMLSTETAGTITQLLMQIPNTDIVDVELTRFIIVFGLLDFR